MGNRFKIERFSRPGGHRSEYSWPTGTCTKKMLIRHGDTVRFGFYDDFATRRDNNRARRGADKETIRQALQYE